MIKKYYYPFQQKTTFNNTWKKANTKKSEYTCWKTHLFCTHSPKNKSILNTNISYEINFTWKHIIYAENKGEGQIKNKKQLFMFLEKCLQVKNGLTPHLCIFMSLKTSKTNKIINYTKQPWKRWLHMKSH